MAAAPWPVPPPPSSPSILDRSVVLSQAALFVGACISVVACMTVVVKYMRFKSVRRPPLSLLFWRTVSDLFFAVQFLVTLFVQLSVSRDSDYGGVFWGKLDEYRDLCSGMAFFTQFTAFASEMWLLMICVDLVLSLTQPFRPLSTTPWRYHTVVWLSSLATAWALLAFDLQGPSAIHICWVATANTSVADLPPSDCKPSKVVWDFSRSTVANWTLFYGWVVAILVFCLLVVAFATARLSEGLQATYEVRLQTIKDLRLYVGTGLSYWIVMATCYLLLLFNCYPDWTRLQPGQGGAAVLWSSMGLVIALKGLLDSLLWHTTARRIVEMELSCRRSARSSAFFFGDGGGAVAAGFSAEKRAACRGALLNGNGNGGGGGGADSAGGGAGGGAGGQHRLAAVAADAGGGDSER